MLLDRYGLAIIRDAITYRKNKYQSLTLWLKRGACAALLVTDINDLVISAFHRNLDPAKEPKFAAPRSKRVDICRG